MMYYVKNYSLNDAGMLLSCVGNLQICQVVDPERTVSMSVPKYVCDKVLQLDFNKQFTFSQKCLKIMMYVKEGENI